MSNEQTEAPANEGNGTGLKVDLRAPSISIGGGSPSKIQADLDSPGPDSDKFARGQNWEEVEKHKNEINNVVSELDDKLNLVLAKQEYEYLKSYNIYVKRKEKELRLLIDKLNEKNSNNTLKDEKINNLEKTIQSIRDD